MLSKLFIDSSEFGFGVSFKDLWFDFSQKINILSLAFYGKTEY